MPENIRGQTGVTPRGKELGEASQVTPGNRGNGGPHPHACRNQVELVGLFPSKPDACPTKMAALADLYDPLSMLPALVKAPAELDRAVDLCCRPQLFTSQRQPVKPLFGLRAT